MKNFNFKQYLIHISYFGNLYSGISKSTGKSVSSAIEEQLLKLLPESKPRSLLVSSRTDAGVHAYWNTLRFITNSNYSCDLSRLRCSLNYFLSINKELIRIHQIKEIPADTNIYLNPCTRTYLYKLCLVPSSNFLWNCVTAWEGQQIFFLSNSNFNVESFEETGKVLSGKYDYSGFTNLSGMLRARDPVKNLKITVTKAIPSSFNMYSHPSLNNNYDAQYFDIFVTAESFMNKMVRHLLGCMIDVGLGLINIDTAKDVLQRGTSFLNNKPFRCAPPYSLYLYNIVYNNTLLNFDINQWESEERLKFEDIEGEPIETLMEPDDKIILNK